MKAYPDKKCADVKVLTIFLMQLMDIVWYLSAEPVVDVDELGPPGDFRAR